MIAARWLGNLDGLSLTDSRSPDQRCKYSLRRCNASGGRGDVYPDVIGGLVGTTYISHRTGECLENEFARWLLAQGAIGTESSYHAEN
jgi:hypothetical protein